MNVKETFPLRLKEARKAKRMTQAKLGKLVSSRSSIAQFETGLHLPCAESLAKLASALNTSADYLLGVSDYNCYGGRDSFHRGLSAEQIETVNCLIRYWREK